MKRRPRRLLEGESISAGPTGMGRVPKFQCVHDARTDSHRWAWDFRAAEGVDAIAGQAAASVPAWSS